MLNSRTLGWTGLLLMLAGTFGFLFVADDRRHIGELIGVGSIMAVGVVSVGLSWYLRRKA